jgi:hypothetical protein
MNTNEDRVREDRVVAHLRAHGLLGGQAVRDVARPRWRGPVIAAAAAVVIGVLSLIADRTLRSPAPSEPNQDPTLLIWY